MNKNTKKRLREYRRKCKKEGWPPFVFKARKRPYPKIRREKPDKQEGL